MKTETKQRCKIMIAQQYYKSKRAGELINFRSEILKKVEGGNENQFLFFDSVADLVLCCTENVRNGLWRNSHQGEKFSDDRDFTYGDTFFDKRTTDKCLTTGSVPKSLLDMVEETKFKLQQKYPELLELQQRARKKKRKTIFSEDGGDLNIDRYMSGEVEQWQSKRRVEKKKTVKVLFNGYMNCNFSADVMVKNTLIMVSLVDILREAGISVEIWHAPIVQTPTNALNLAAVFCKIKGANEPVDISRLLSSGATGLFREYNFTIWVNALKGTERAGLGKTPQQDIEFIKNHYEFDLMLNATGREHETMKMVTDTLNKIL